MPTLESREPDPDRALQIAHHGLILLGLVGSTVHGLRSLRIAHQGTEFLTTGTITLPVAEPRRTEIMAIRRGEVDSAAALDAVARAAGGLEDALASTSLPERVDDDRLDAWLAATYRQAWDAAG
jgi:hypothetical protein